MSETISPAVPHDMAGNSSTFSYAQAAKGKINLQNGSAEVSGPPADAQREAEKVETSVTQGQEPAELNKDASTAKSEEINGFVGDALGHVENPTPKETTEKDFNESTVSNQQSMTQSPKSPPAPLPSPPLPSQAVQPLKEDDVFATQLESDSTWEKLSQGSRIENSSSKTEGSADDMKLSTWEQVQAPKLKEAPIPTVNVWEKRRDEQAKAKEFRPSSTQLPRSHKPEQPTEVPRDNSKRKVENSSVVGKDRVAKAQSPEGKFRKASKYKKSGADQLQGQTPQRGSRTRTPEEQKASGVMAPPPPPGDATSWPTPNLAKGEEKKKTQDRLDRTDKEKTPSKPHGKDKWEKIDYVPTAVFSTPNLPTPRRGGRLSGRGGRDAGARGGHVANGGSGAPDRAVSGPASAAPSSSATPPNERSKADVPSARSGPFDSRSRRSASAGPPSSREHQRGIDGTQDKRDEGGARQFTGKPFRDNRRVSVSTQAGSHYAGENYRRSSIISDQHQVHASSGDYTSSRPLGDKRGEGYGREMNGYVPVKERREGRPERGRGGYRSKASQNHANYGGNGNHAANGHAFSSNKFPPFPEQRHTSQPHAGTFSNPREPRHNRASSRSQSIPNPQNYGRYSNGMAGPGPHQLPPLQIGAANMYPYGPEHQGPMSAVSWHPYMHNPQIQGMLQMQMEYYFSVENLCKDMFLRKRMDSQGFVLLQVLQQFNRIKVLIAEDPELIRWACFRSPMVEIVVGPDKLDRVRRAGDWQQWVLNMEERDPSAQNDGPTEVQEPFTAPPPHLPMYGPYDYPRASIASTPLSPTEALAGNGGSTEAALLDGTGPSGQANDSQPAPTPLSATVPDFKPSYQVFSNASYESVADSVEFENNFSDDQIDSLNIIVRRPKISTSQAEGSPEAQCWPTVDYGNNLESLQLLEIENNELPERSDHENPKEAADGKSFSSDSGSGVVTKSLSSSQVCSDGRDAEPRDYYTELIHWQTNIKTLFEEGSEDVMRESYPVFKNKALRWRDQARDGECHGEMTILYEFWSHFLVRNLNVSMYNEFHFFARVDASDRNSNVGLGHLITLYSRWLLGPDMIPNRLVWDFIDIVNSEVGKSETLALDELRAVWRDSALPFKNRIKLSSMIDDELRAIMEC